jgi:hypothetical protein
VDDAKFFLTFPGVALLPRSLDDRRRKMGDILKSIREPLICIIVNMGDIGYVYRLGRLHAAPANSRMQGLGVRVRVCVCVFVVGSSKSTKLRFA